LIPLYLTAMAAGYATFGDACQTNILLNYHPDDILSNLGRVATWVSLLFGFPLVSSAALHGIVGVVTSFGFPSIGDDQNHMLLVIVYLMVVTLIACLFDDVSLAVGLTGSSIGSLLAYVCPPLLYVSAIEIVHGNDSLEYHKARRNLRLVPFGILIGVIGAYEAFQRSHHK
jgi:amino acid permease